MPQVLGRPPLTLRPTLYLRTARRSASRHGVRPGGVLRSLDPRLVFVVGCPRSGTTFTASALGRVPGFADLGEVNRLKAGIPGIYASVQQGHHDAAVAELRRILTRSQRVAMVAGSRGVEQTPEATFLIPHLALAFPQAKFVHLVRDGRDVAASLVERGWLSDASSSVGPSRGAVDDAGHRFGTHARFWVEPERVSEFERCSEARRCAWAWRRYVAAALGHLSELEPWRVSHVRYERLAADPVAVSAELSEFLDEGRMHDRYVAGFGAMHSRSVGRHAALLNTQQLADVVDEAGDLLERLDYCTG